MLGRALQGLSSVRATSYCPSPPSAQMQDQRSGGGSADGSAVTAVDDLEKMVESLLSFARTEIENDRPNEALNAVVHAIRLSRGEEGIAAVRLTHFQCLFVILYSGTGRSSQAQRSGA